MTTRLKVILTVVGIVVVIGALAIAIIALRRGETEAPPRGRDQVPVVPVDTGPPSEQVRVTALADAIAAGSDPSVCEQAGSTEAADHCFALAAYGGGDSTLCGRVSTLSARYECEALLVSDRAEDEGNPELCRALEDPELRISCYVRATLERGTTETFCGGLSEPDRTSCLATITLDPTLEERTPSPGDADRDGLSDSDEARLGTDPEVADTDGDGLPDGAEPSQHRTDPLKSDTDGDGLADGDEVGRGTDPRSEDTDGDGLGDRDEINRALDPKSADTDSDGLTDGDEVNRYQTDPKNSDTDGDSFSDGTEVQNGYNPRGPGRL